MGKYRKKPVVVEAMKLTDENRDEVQDWIRMHVDNACMCLSGRDCAGNSTLHIQTLEGMMTATIGDYIIKGVQGEFYPCNPDIFMQTYEAIEK